MFEQYTKSMDDQAKWEFIQEVDRYHRKLRQMEAVKLDQSPDLLRTVSQEHLQRVNGIYAQLEVRQHQGATSGPFAMAGAVQLQ